MADNTIFKNLLLRATVAPVRRTFPNVAQAHDTRFKMYNTLKRMRKAIPPDPYGDMKDVLEFIVKELPDGQGELTIQPKSTKLVGSLEDWGIPNSPAPVESFLPPTQLQEMQAQLRNETPKTIDPSSTVGGYLENQAAITDYMFSLEDRLPSEAFARAKTIRQRLGPNVLLEDLKEELSAHGIH